MNNLPIQIINLLASSAILVFVCYYFLRFNRIEKEIEKKEGKIDTEYHQIVDTALEKERKILEDASRVADKIIAQTEYVSSASKEVVDQALQKMINDIQKETVATAHEFMNSYSASLKELSIQSQKDFKDVAAELGSDLKKQMGDFQNVAKELEIDLQKQIRHFHDSLLPNLEKELENYKQERLKQTEQIVTTIVQKASIEILNKSFSLEDHQKLVLESLEKAKKEGVIN